MLASVKEEDDHPFVEFVKDVNSMKKMLKVKDKRCAEFLNEINSIKNQIKSCGQGILNSRMRWILRKR
jgi:DNA-binding FrmR family transcriptional regulator